MVFENKLHKIIIIISSCIASLLFLFSLFSGAEPGFIGILKNVMNTIPWIILGVLVFISYKWPIVGGSCILTLGISSILMFNFYRSENILGLFTIALPITILGGLFIYSSFLSKKQK